MGIGFTIKQIKNWSNNLGKFWELHPSARSMGAFRDLHTKDKSPYKTKLGELFDEYSDKGLEVIEESIGEILREN